MNEQKIKSHLKTLGAELLGNFIIAIGLYNFAVMSNFPVTGFSGIAVVLYRLFGLPIGVMTIVLNIPVAILCYRMLGRGFFLRSIRCMIISSLMIDYLAPLLPVYEGERILSALCAGALQGIGYGIIYKNGTSTGGLDFITIAIKTKWPHLSMGGITFAADTLIIVGASILFHDYEGIIYGVIINYLVSFGIDKIMFGANAGKLLLIITDDGPGIAKVIDEASSRGSTILNAQGGYRQDHKAVVMCACSTKQVVAVQTAVKEVDPASFIIIMDSSEIHGEGFRYTSVGHTE